MVESRSKRSRSYFRFRTPGKHGSSENGGTTTVSEECGFSVAPRELQAAHRHAPEIQRGVGGERAHRSGGHLRIAEFAESDYRRVWRVAGCGRDVADKHSGARAGKGLLGSASGRAQPLERDFQRRESEPGNL